MFWGEIISSNEKLILESNSDGILVISNIFSIDDISIEFYKNRYGNKIQT